MNRDTQEQMFEQMIETMRGIMFRKGNDYANQDRLSNFKLAGSICGLTAELNCLSLIATKVARLGVLLQADSAPNNESIEDSVVDLANYAILLRMILADTSRPVEVRRAITTPEHFIADRLRNKRENGNEYSGTDQGVL